ncbi:MAG: cytochrome c [Chitinophagales bacterium]|jgi:nitrite reductase (NO-forming)|nr:cytochrome c [Chitinophagales bacterium]
MNKVQQKISLALSLCLVAFIVACGGGEPPKTDPNAPPPQSMVKEDVPDGKAIYTKTCQACHQENGQGVPKAFPPLANADVLNSNVEGAIDGVIHGRKGELIVNGEKYNTEMAPLGGTLNDAEIAAVLTYVYSQWGNNGSVITPEMVAARRTKK